VLKKTARTGRSNIWSNRCACPSFRINILSIHRERDSQWRVKHTTSVNIRSATILTYQTWM
jgi:hypothetical protein